MRKNVKTVVATCVIALLAGAVPVTAFAEEPEATATEETVEDVSSDAQSVISGINEALGAAADTTEEVTTEVQEQAADGVIEDTQQQETVQEAQPAAAPVAGDFAEGSATLTGYNYVPGTLTEKGWENAALNMKYVPDGPIVMGLTENAMANEYHLRNGADKQVAVNEMVAADDRNGYVQIMVEVNPNRESAKDILDRFAKLENLELVSSTRDMDVAENNFQWCTGIRDRARYMLGVCTDVSPFVIALKVKYENMEARDALMKGFEAVEKTEAQEEETESLTEAEGTDVVELPEDFEQAEIISEAVTEAEEE